MKSVSFFSVIILSGFASEISGYAFVARKNILPGSSTRSRFASSAPLTTQSAGSRQSTSLKMIDEQILKGGAIGVAGLVAGIGLVVFTEKQGERAKERGSGLSDGMSTRIAGGLLEDVEVSSVDDLGSLTSQLEKALRESGGANEKELEMSEEDKKRIADEADDGW